jgi:hypothetical protein
MADTRVASAEGVILLAGAYNRGTPPAASSGVARGSWKSRRLVADSTSRQEYDRGWDLWKARVLARMRAEGSA